MTELPTGITLHQGKYRVRLYVRSKPFHGGYHTSLSSALTALEDLKKYVQSFNPPDESLLNFFIYRLPPAK